MDVSLNNPAIRRPAMIQRVYGLSPQPEDFHRLIERYRSLALMGYIHEKKFHLSQITAPEAIPSHIGTHWEGSAIRYCSSCGKRLPHRPLCTGCLLYL